MPGIHAAAVQAVACAVACTCIPPLPERLLEGLTRSSLVICTLQQAVAAVAARTAALAAAEPRVITAAGTTKWLSHHIALH